MKEEDRHWTFAKLFYDKKFTDSNLQIAFKKEKLKNKFRMFYFKNVMFLNKIFDPIINGLILIFGSITILLKSNSSSNKNLMTIIAGWGGVDPTTSLGSILIVFTQLIAIMLAAILTGVVATAYNAQVTRREAQYETLVREVLEDGVVDAEEQEELDLLKKKFGMTDEQVEMIAEQVRVENEEKEEKAKFSKENPDRI